MSEVSHEINLATFNEFYLELAKSIHNSEHFEQEVAQPSTTTPPQASTTTATAPTTDLHPYSKQLVQFYRNHNWYNGIFDQEKALPVIAILAPTEDVLKYIRPRTARTLFAQVVEIISNDKKMSFKEGTRRFYDRIQDLDGPVNGYTKQQLNASLTEAVEQHQVKQTDSPKLDRDFVKKIIHMHLDTYGIKKADDFRRVMDGKNVWLFALTIIVSAGILALLIIFRNTLAYGDNFVANFLGSLSDNTAISPLLSLFVVFVLVLLVLIWSIYSFVKFQEKRRLFLRNTPVLIKALEVDENHFNEIIDEKFYGEKLKLRKRTFA